MSLYRAAAVILVAGCAGLLAGCSGGGGGGSRGTPTFASSTTPTSTPTPTATATAPPGVLVTGVFPALGSAVGGNAVLVEGSGFTRGNNTVAFGGLPATGIIVLGDRKISCLAPPGTAGQAVAVTVSSDAGSDSIVGAYRYAGGGTGSVLDVELSGNPTVTFDGQIGTTTVVLDYLVRDGNGIPLSESDLKVNMFIDGIQLGAGGVFNESVLGRDSEELDLSVLVLMVLDASYSLQQFRQPQFAPMLRSAQDLVDAGENIWRTRGGTFHWNVVWFDELISRPDPDHVDTFRIADIPEPQPGNFTKLYSAVSSALELSATLRREGVAAGPRDSHVLVVFTDGQDNLSSFDNRNVMLQGMLRNGDPYPRIGWRATDLPDVFTEIALSSDYPAHLTVHTIALGASCQEAPAGAACFDEPALSQIAQVGFGQQLSSADDVSDLFDQIQKEFTTLQSSGAKMALAPGDYEFRLMTELKNRRAAGEVVFTLRVRENGAEFVEFQ